MNQDADRLNAKAVLTYFKPDTGKYYASGEYLIPASAYLVDVWDQVRQWNTYGGLPGLDERSTGWIVHVECPGHPNDHPKLILS